MRHFAAAQSTQHVQSESDQETWRLYQLESGGDGEQYWSELRPWEASVSVDRLVGWGLFLANLFDFASQLEITGSG